MAVLAVSVAFEAGPAALGADATRTGAAARATDGSTAKGMATATTAATSTMIRVRMVRDRPSVPAECPAINAPPAALPVRESTSCPRMSRWFDLLTLGRESTTHSDKSERKRGQAKMSTVAEFASIPSIDLDALVAFLELAREGHFGRAAANLHMSQSALTRQIQLLECRLPVPRDHPVASIMGPPRAHLCRLTR